MFEASAIVGKGHHDLSKGKVSRGEGGHEEVIKEEFKLSLKNYLKFITSPPHLTQIGSLHSFVVPKHQSVRCRSSHVSLFFCV